MKNTNKNTKINVEDIKKAAKLFKEKEYEMSDIPLVKKTDIENTCFIVYEIQKVLSEEGKEYFNFRCLNEKDEEFCFNGSSILKTQLDDFGTPCKVKLMRRHKPEDKLKPYYWIFAGCE